MQKGINCRGLRLLYLRMRLICGEIISPHNLLTSYSVV
uniref:Uncharacterized protein n=1 Tax=Arundo donax TaxID=35708 RepID=A0A0A9FEL7_ARUDO